MIINHLKAHINNYNSHTPDISLCNSWVLLTLRHQHELSLRSNAIKQQIDRHKHFDYIFNRTKFVLLITAEAIEQICYINCLSNLYMLKRRANQSSQTHLRTNTTHIQSVLAQNTRQLELSTSLAVSQIYKLRFVHSA